MVVKRCTSIRADGTPCRANALPDSAYCFSHDPAVRERRIEGNRRGGHARSTARRAARHWAAVGHEIADGDLPALLKATILDVRTGKIEPSVATAIATLAKTAVAITVDIDLEQRIAALEQDAGLSPSRLRRVK
jgi:hypothetical protein